MTDRKQDGTSMPLARRGFLKALGVSGALVGSAGITAADDASGWLLQHLDHSERRRRNSIDAHVRNTHQLLYLGAEWDAFTSPKAGEEGSWQHTFVLSAFGFSLDEHTTDALLGPDETEYKPEPYIKGTSLGVVGQKNWEQVAVAPRRDSDLYGFFDPDVLAAGLTDVTLTEGGTIEGLSPKEQLMLTLSGDPSLAKAISSAELEAYQAQVQAEEEFDENKQALVEFLLLQGLGKLTGEVGGLADDIFTALTMGRDIRKLAFSLDDLDVDRFTVSEGFRQSLPYPDQAGLFVDRYFPAGGHFVMFDVYVPPNEEATVSIESGFELDNRTTVDFDNPYTEPGSLEKSESDPVWEVRLERLSRPENDGPQPYSAAPLRHAARPLAMDDEVAAGGETRDSLTNVPLNIREAASGAPTASFSVSPRTLAPDESFTVDASSSQPTRAPIATYDWVVKRVYPPDEFGIRPADGDPVRIYTNTVSADLHDGVESTGALDVADAGFDRWYDVLLTVSDREGTADSTFQELYVPNTLPELKLTMPSTVQQGETVTFDASKTRGTLADEDFQWTVELVATSRPSDVEPVDFDLDDPELVSAPSTADWGLEGPAPTHEFDGPKAEYWRVYEVSLAVENPWGNTDSMRKRLVVPPEPNEPPEPTFTIEDTADATEGDVVRFDAGATVDPNGPADIVDYEWAVTWVMDPDDTPLGEEEAQRWESSGPEAATAAFTVPEIHVERRFDVTLTVTDDDGATGVKNRSFRLQGVPNPKPTLDVAVDYDGKGVGQPVIVDDTAVTFTATVDDDEPLDSVVWTYPEGADRLATYEGTQFTHTFTEPGEKPVTISVTDQDGVVVSEQLAVVVVDNPAPTAEIVGATDVTEGDTVTYRAVTTDDRYGSIVSHEWDIVEPEGDSLSSSTATGESYTRTFERDDDGFALTLTVTDDDGATATDSVVVDVNDLPDVTLDGPTLVAPGSTATYEAVASDRDGIASYDWTTPDGSDDAARTQAVTFPETSGEYDLSVTVTDPLGASTTATRTVTVNRAPSVQLRGPDSVVTRGSQTVEYIADVVDDDTDLDYQWTVAEGGTIDPAAGSGPIFTKSLAAGRDDDFRVVVTVTDPYDQTASADRSVTVEDPPQVSLTGPGVVAPGGSATYDANGSEDGSGDAIDRFEWSTPEGAATTSGDSLTVSFPETSGEYDLSVTAYDTAGVSRTDSTTVRVNRTPAVTIRGPSAVDENESHTYRADVDDDDTDFDYEWTVAVDGTVDPAAGSGSQLSYYFADASDLTLTLTVTDPYGATASDTVTVSVNAVPRIGLSGPEQVEVGSSAGFTATGGDPDGSIVEYRWSDGAVTSSSSHSFDFESTGTKRVSVTAEDGRGATDGASASVDVVEPLSVSITGDTSVAEGDTETYGADVSGGTGGYSYSWVYGSDGTLKRDSGSQVTQTFDLDDDGFVFSLTVTDDSGATASDTVTVSVRNVNDAPSVSLSASSTYVEEFNSVSFSTRTSDPDGDSLSYSWSGADISGSGGSTTWYSSGSYTVTVTVADGNGGSDTDSVTVDVYESDDEPIDDGGGGGGGGGGTSTPTPTPTPTDTPTCLDDPNPCVKPANVAAANDDLGLGLGGALVGLGAPAALSERFRVNRRALPGRGDGVNEADDSGVSSDASDGSEDGVNTEDDDE